jgi:hypothetical protein
MNILKKRQKYNYIEKRDKHNKNLINAHLSGTIEDVVNTKRPPPGEALVHEYNKNISKKYKENYDKINWKKNK